MGFRSDVRDFFGAILGLGRPSGPWCFPVREGGAFVGEQHLFSSRRSHKPLFFLRGRRQGRQPLNPAMPRRVVWEAKHSFSYPGARPCRRPSPKILQPAGVFTFLGVRGGKKEGKI